MVCAQLSANTDTSTDIPIDENNREEIKSYENTMRSLVSFLMFVLVSSSFYSQSDSAKTKLKPYVSVGVSIGNVDPSDSLINNFSKASYPSMEIGLSGKYVSIGAVLGCENFFVSSSSRGFYELKAIFSKTLDKCTAYALFGAGAYFEKSFNNFIEYGAGFSYMPDKVGYFVQYSNWARTNYVSVGLTVCF
jgi:hypothetical protein